MRGSGIYHDAVPRPSATGLLVPSGAGRVPNIVKRMSIRSNPAVQLLAIGAAAAALIGATPVAAQETTLGQALDETSGSASDGAVAQAQINGMSDETAELLAEYRHKTQEFARLDAYNRHLEALVADQQAKLTRMDGEMVDALKVQRAIIPLMVSMIENLAAFVAADMPILGEERRERLQRLRANMSDADVTTAEKYRQIMEAYKVEMDIGRKIGTYSGTVARDGRTRAVNFLYVGRIVLAYQSEDRTVTAFWNRNAGQAGWENLPDEYRNHIDNAMRIANKQAAPDLMKLPIAAPEAAR